MAHITNSPHEKTILRLESRKSFALGIFIADQNDRPLDITAATIRMVARKEMIPAGTTDDSGNILLNSVATIVDGPGGFAKFLLQAEELEDPPGDYIYAIVLVDGGYSSVIVEGDLILEQNPEWTSTQEMYNDSDVASALRVQMEGRHVIKVHVGHALPPGTQNFTDSDKEKLDTIQPGAEVNVQADWSQQDSTQDNFINSKPPHLLPAGGVKNEVVTKLSSAEQDAGWRFFNEGNSEVNLIDDPDDEGFFIQGDGTDLDADGVPPNYAPVSDGSGNWSWQPIVGTVTSVNGQLGDVLLDLDDIPDTTARLAMTQAERDKLANLAMNWDDIQGKPAFGTASLLNVEQVLEPGEVNASTDITSGTINKARVPKVSALQGFTSGTANPSGGSAGDLYFQYT